MFYFINKHNTGCVKDTQFTYHAMNTNNKADAAQMGHSISTLIGVFVFVYLKKTFSYMCNVISLLFKGEV